MHTSFVTRAFLMFIFLLLLSCCTADPEISIEPREVSLNDSLLESYFFIKNVASDDGIFIKSVEELKYNIYEKPFWLQLSPLTGTCPSGSYDKIDISLLIDSLVYGENIVGKVLISSNGGDAELIVKASRNLGAPRVRFTATPTSGPVPLEVKFIDESDSGGMQITSWKWDFGDGVISYEQNPTHVYTDIGKYSVSLVITTPSMTDSLIKVNYINVVYRSCMEKEDIIYNLIYSYRHTDISQYEKILHDDYIWYNQGRDTNTCGNYYSRDRDLRIVRHMFEAANGMYKPVVDELFLDIPISEPDSLNPNKEWNKIDTIPGVGACDDCWETVRKYKISVKIRERDITYVGDDMIRLIIAPVIEGENKYYKIIRGYDLNSIGKYSKKFLFH